MNGAFSPPKGQGLWGQGTTAGSTAAPPAKMTQAEMDKANKDFNAMVANDKKLYVDGQEADPKALATQSGQATTFGTGKNAITIQADQSPLTIGKNDTIKPITG